MILCFSWKFQLFYVIIKKERTFSTLCTVVQSQVQSTRVVITMQACPWLVETIWPEILPLINNVELQPFDPSKTKIHKLLVVPVYGLSSVVMVIVGSIPPCPIVIPTCFLNIFALTTLFQSTVLATQLSHLYIWPVQISQLYGGDCPANTVYRILYTRLSSHSA